MSAIILQKTGDDVAEYRPGFQMIPLLFVEHISGQFHISNFDQNYRKTLLTIIRILL